MSKLEEVPVVSLVKRPPVAFKPENTVMEAVVKMAEENIGSIIIVDDNFKPIGVFTERDVVRRVLAGGVDPEKTKLREVMTSRPITVREGESAKRALELMLHFGFRHLPVVDSDGRLVGVVSIRDVSRPFAGEIDVTELHSVG